MFAILVPSPGGWHARSRCHGDSTYKVQNVAIAVGIAIAAGDGWSRFLVLRRKTCAYSYRGCSHTRESKADAEGAILWGGEREEGGRGDRDTWLVFAGHTGTTYWAHDTEVGKTPAQCRHKRYLCQHKGTRVLKEQPEVGVRKTIVHLGPDTPWTMLDCNVEHGSVSTDDECLTLLDIRWGRCTQHFRNLIRACLKLFYQ